MERNDSLIGTEIRGVTVLKFDEESWIKDCERVKRGDIKQTRRRYICKCNYCGSTKSIAAYELLRGRRRNTYPEEIGCGCRKLNHIMASAERRRKTNSFVHDTECQCYIGVDGNNNSFIVDEQTYDLIKDIYWRLDGRYFRGCVPGLRAGVLLHRFVVFGFDVDNSSGLVDHINGNRADCRLCNLRISDCSKNSFNRKVGKNNKSGKTGVYWNKNAGRWAASISVNTNSIFLGYFDSVEEASEARMKAEIKYYGELSRS